MAANKDWRKARSVYDFSVRDLGNREVDLSKYRGKVLLIVNIASSCPFAERNYLELNELFERYRDQGFVILGFPCNQFGGQEPGYETDIKEFIKKNKVEWDIFAKIDVNGDNAISLYKYLKNKGKAVHLGGGTTEAPHGLLVNAIKWNFTKFLINRKGEPVGRFAPNKNPMDIEEEIKTELVKPA